MLPVEVKSRYLNFRQQVPDSERARERAAPRIQASGRGMAIQQQTKLRPTAQDPTTSMDAQEHAAVRIQALHRGIVARRHTDITAWDGKPIQAKSRYLEFRGNTLGPAGDHKPGLRRCQNDSRTEAISNAYLTGRDAPLLLRNRPQTARPLPRGHTPRRREWRRTSSQTRRSS